MHSQVTESLDVLHAIIVPEHIVSFVILRVNNSPWGGTKAV